MGNSKSTITAPNKDKAKKTIDGYIREQSLNIPADITKLILLYYQIVCEILPFDSKYMGTGIMLSDNKKCATKKSGSQIYLLAGGNPASKGEHLWRLRVECDQN